MIYVKILALLTSYNKDFAVMSFGGVVPERLWGKDIIYSNVYILSFYGFYGT